jgi:hypothetical protein
MTAVNANDDATSMAGALMATATTTTTRPAMNTDNQNAHRSVLLRAAAHPGRNRAADHALKATGWTARLIHSVTGPTHLNSDTHARRLHADVNSRGRVWVRVFGIRYAAHAKKAKHHQKFSNASHY